MISSLTVMSGATIAPSLPSMQTYFAEVPHVGFWIRLVLTMPALLIVISAPLSGLIVDRSGRLRLLIPSLLLYGVAGSSGLYLDSIGAILVGRALLGVAVAGAMTTATTLIADYYDGPERSKFMGYQAAFMGVGGVLFLTGGGALAELGWRWPFAIYLFSLILIPLTLLTLREPVREEASSQSGESTASYEKKPFKLLAFIYVAGFTGMTIFYFIPLQIPFYLEMLVDAGPTISGFAIALSTTFAVMTSLMYGRIYARTGYVVVLGLNFGLMGLGYILIGFADSLLPVLAGLMICGLGMGLMFPNLNVWLTREVSPSIRGRAVGGLTTSVFLGQFMSPMASQPLVASFSPGVMYWSAGMLLLFLAMLFVLFRKSILSFTISSEIHPPT